MKGWRRRRRGIALITRFLEAPPRLWQRRVSEGGLGDFHHGFSPQCLPVEQVSWLTAVALPGSSAGAETVRLV